MSSKKDRRSREDMRAPSVARPARNQKTAAPSADKKQVRTRKMKQQSESQQRKQQNATAYTDSSESPDGIFGFHDDSTTESDDDEVRYRFTPRVKYPKDFLVQNRARSRSDQLRKTNEMVERAADVIIIITSRLMWMELMEAFSSQAEELEMQVVDLLQEIELATEEDFLKEAMGVLMDRKFDMDFTCSGMFRQHRKARILVSAWGIYRDLQDERRSNMQAHFRQSFSTKKSISDWIDQRWLRVVLRTVQRWSGGFADNLANSRTGSSRERLTKRIFSHIQGVSEAMCVAQAVQADTELHTGRPYKHEGERAKYVTELLNWKVQNAVKRRDEPFIHEFMRGEDTARGKNDVDRKAEVYREQVNRLNAVTQRGGLCEIPAERWKTIAARGVLIVALIVALLTGGLNVGERSNTFERVTDGASIGTVILAAIFGPWKLKSDDQDVLTKIIFGIKRSTSFSDVAKFVCQGDRSQLAFLMHLVQGDRNWLAADGACFVRGRTTGSVSARVPITGRALAAAGSIYGLGVLLAPDWKTYYAVTGSEQHANLEQRESVQATNLGVTGLTRFTGRQCTYCGSWEQLDDVV